MLHGPYCCGCAVLAFSLIVCNGALSLLWAGLGPCVRGPVWGYLGLEWNQTRRLPELGTFPMLSPEKLLLVDMACGQSRCLPAVHYWGHGWTGVCGYLPPSLPGWCWSLVKLLAHCRACHTTVDKLLPRAFEGRRWRQGMGASKVHTGLLWEGFCSHPGNLLRPRWREPASLPHLQLSPKNLLLSVDRPLSSVGLCPKNCFSAVPCACC